MFRSVFAFVLVLFFQLFLIVMAASLTSLWIDALSIKMSITSYLILWIIYLVGSDYIFFYIYKARRAKFNSELKLIFKNFSFRNRERDLQIFSSPNSPLFMRIGLFNSARLVVNKELLSGFSVDEVRAYLDLELSFSRKISSFIEVLTQRVFFVTWLPLKKVLSLVFGDVVASVLVSPLTLLYKYVITSVRSEYVYEGKFVSTLPQIIFKVKILDMSHGVIPLFNFSEKCTDLMLKGKEGGAMITRFDPDEIFR
ncbi:MAG: hypothetical protein BM556_08425 [Bacteriovorax sp. MedPE-SWde]|nr:MAG: hypothetical protein BM556_08425 [Bacteriovorax sp. MedPE-SWde]